MIATTRAATSCFDGGNNRNLFITTGAIINIMMTMVNLIITLTFCCDLTFGHQLPRAQRANNWAPLREAKPGRCDH